MKNLEDMDTTELVDYITGQLILSIGRGDFRSTVITWVLTLQKLGYDRGLASAKRGVDEQLYSSY